MRLVVLGASGGTGQHLVRRALADGHAVTAVVRDPARLPLRDPALDVRTADVTDRRALVSVLDGQDAVLSALGVRGNRAAGIVATATAAVLGAMRTTGPRRLVAVSAAPVGPVPPDERLVARFLVRPLVRRAFREIYADLARMEREVAVSDAEWTILRPPRLLDRAATGRYRTAVGGAVRGAMTLSRADLAHAMLACLTDRATVRQFVGLAD